MCACVGTGVSADLCFNLTVKAAVWPRGGGGGYVWKQMLLVSVNACQHTWRVCVSEGTKCLGELQGKLAVPPVHTRLGQMYTFLFPHAGSRQGSVCAPSVFYNFLNKTSLLLASFSRYFPLL